MNSLSKFLIFSSLLVFLIPAYLYRVAYFSIIVDMAAIVYLLPILSDKVGQIRKNKLKKNEQSGEAPILSGYFKITPIVASFFAFIAVSILAVIFSVDIRDSFWGYPAGHSLAGGFFVQIHYFLFFMVVVSIFKKRENYLNLLKFFVGVAFIIDLYGLYEKFIIEKVRVDSLFGNPIHLGVFALFVIFFSTYLFLVTNNKALKVSYVVSTIVALMAMFYSESRGPFMGLVGSLVVAVPIALFWAIRKIKNKKVLLFSVAGVLLVAISAVYFLMDSNLVSRFKNISNDRSVSNRVKVWSIAFEAIKEKPILGWGQDNFDLAFNKYFDSELLSDAGSESWFDRAHNNILDIWTTTGTLGVIAYLSMWFCAMWAIFNMWKRQYFKEAIVFSLALISFFISNLTFFDVLVTFIPFALILGFLNNFGFQDTEKLRELKIADYLVKSLIIILVISVIVGIQLVRGSHYYYSLKAKGVSVDAAVGFHDKLVSLTPAVFKEESIYSLAWLLNRGNVSNEAFNEYYKNSIDELSEISDNQPFEIKPLYYISELYLKDYELNDNKSSLDEAKKVIEKTLALSPSRQDLYVALAQIEMQKENYDEAVEYIKKVQELNPYFARSYFFMSIMYLLNDQPEESDEQLEMAKKYGVIFFPADISNLVFLANHYIFERKDYPQAIYLLDGILSVDYYNIQALKKTAALYAEMGDKEKAIKYAKRVIEAGPNNRVDAENFIKSLGGIIE